jgi:hypothetical protein
MPDMREQILSQMLALMTQVGTGWAAQVNGDLSVFRNRAEIPADKLPALVLLDGSENLKAGLSKSLSLGLVPGQVPPQIMVLTPQVFIICKPRDTIENAGVGPELSAMRVKLLNAMLNDDVLGSLLGSNGDIAYLGHQTDLQTGSTVLGQMQLNFQLSYVLDPNNLN